MTNKPMLSVERELLERIAKPLKILADKPYRTKAILELRAILDKPNAWPCWSCKKLVSMSGRADADGGCPHCSVELDIEAWPFPPNPAAQHQGHPVNRLSYSQGDRRYVNGWNDACSHWEEQATKPQGEVERLRRLIDSKEVERQQCIEECSAEVGALRAQLAEQPAPVAPDNSALLGLLVSGISIDDNGFYHLAGINPDNFKRAIEASGATLSENIPAHKSPVALVMPERMKPEDNPEHPAGKWAADLYNSALDEVARLNGVKP